MLGYETFLLERENSYGIENTSENGLLVILALDKDEKSLWFDVQSTFVAAYNTRLAFTKGKYRKMVPPDDEFFEDMQEPRIFFNGEAAIEVAKSLKDTKLIEWLEENIQYYECPDMDWTVFKDPLDA